VFALVLLGRASGLERVRNIGGSRGYSLNELIDLIREATRLTAKVVYRPGRPIDEPSVVLDISHAGELLNWHPEVELEEGIESTWRWTAQLEGLS
jgi:UDP-glucose 4-epimerase